METALLAARILAIVYLSFFFGLLISSTHYKREIPKLVNNSAFLIFAGWLAILFGFILLEFNAGAAATWTIAITIIAWMAIIKGVLLLVFPQAFSSFQSIFLSEKYWLYIRIGMLIFGLFFGYFGFISEENTP